MSNTGGSEHGERNLVLLPAVLLEIVMSKLDVGSLCSLAVTCKTLKSNVARYFGFAANFHLLDVAPSKEELSALLPPNPHMISLKLDCSRLDDSAIGSLIRPSLHELCLLNCKDFSGKLLHEIGKICKNLRVLTLGSVAEGRGRTIYHLAIEHLFSGCSQLKVMRLMFDLSLYLRPDTVRVLSVAPYRLAHLEFGHVAADQMTKLLYPPSLSNRNTPPAILQNVRILRLSLDYITDALIKAISAVLVSLTHLDLRDAPVMEPRQSFDLTNAGLQDINLNFKLQHLSLIRSQEYFQTSFKRVNDQGILFLADRCSDVESICLGGFCRVTDAGFKTILHSCKRLYKLNIYHGIQLTDLVFHDMSATSLSLTHVSLRRCRLLTHEVVWNLVSNLKLEHLDLRGCTSLSDETLDAITHLPKLKVLLMDGCDISDTGLMYLKQGIIGSLVSLSVRGCKKLTDRSICALFDSSSKLQLCDLDLSNLPRLTDTSVLAIAKSGAPIRRLRMRECPFIGDTSVMALASTRVDEDRCPGSSLRLLDLYECRGITQLLFKWLKHPYFPRLRWLGITGSVNRDIVDALARKRPSLHVLRRGEELKDEHDDDWESLDVPHYTEAQMDELEQLIEEAEDEEMENGEVAGDNEDEEMGNGEGSEDDAEAGED